QDRQTSARLNLADGRRRVGGITRRGVRVVGAGDVDQMIRNAALLGDGNLVRANVGAAIDGRRVTRDDLAAKAFGKMQAQRALARRSRADDGEKKGTDSFPLT